MQSRTCIDMCTHLLHLIVHCLFIMCVNHICTHTDKYEYLVQGTLEIAIFGGTDRLLACQWSSFYTGSHVATEVSSGWLT